MKRPLHEAVGMTVHHKRLGPCYIREVVNKEEGKVKTIILNNNEEKVLIFSPQFFDGIDDFETVEVKVRIQKPKKKVHKRVDLSKYRNHPLVKEIEAKEKGYKPRDLYEDSLTAKEHVSIKEIGATIELDEEY
jgi:hypothetical protein